MTNLEQLSTNELLMLKDLLENDIECTGWGEIDYSDVNLMQYYLNRAKVLAKVREVLGS